MGRAVFPPCCLAWGQTMVEVMKIMVTSFQRSHACSTVLCGSSPAAGHCWPTPLQETTGHSEASLSQSPVASLLLSPGSWCTQGFVCALEESVSSVLCKFWWLCGRINGDLLRKGLCHTQVCGTQSSCPCGRPLLTGPPQKTLKHSSGLVCLGSLGPGMHKVCLSPPSVSGGYRVWFKCYFTPPTILLGLLLGSNILLSTVVQQRVLILEFSQENISAHPSTLPSCESMTSRFKGLDMIECLKNCGQRFMTLNRRQWLRPSPRKRNEKRQNDYLRKPCK